MANIEGLAPEILLSILSRLSHLHDLHHLLMASPACSRVFDAYAATIVEAVLSEPPSTFPKHMQHLVRTLVLIRAGRFPLPDLEAAMAHCIGVSITRLEKRQVPPLPFAPGPGSIPPDTAPGILRSVVATSSQIHALAYDCIHAYLRKFNALRPQHCHHEHFAYKRFRGTALAGREEPPTEVFGLPPWDREFPGTPYVPAADGPPRWTELMRAVRALWRICIYFDLQTAGRRDLLPAWPAESLRALQETPLLEAASRMDQTSIYHPSSELEEIRSVLEYVMRNEQEEEEVLPDCVARTTRRHRLPAPRLAGRDTTTPPVDWSVPVPEYDFFMGDTGFYFDWNGRNSRIDPTWRSREWVDSFRHSEARELDQSHRSIRTGAPGMQYFYDISRADAQWSPLWRSKFDPYRALGMAFWDGGRLVAMELLEKGLYVGRDCYTFTWRSLLTADQLAEVKATIRTVLDEATPEERARWTDRWKRAY